jgi:intracellular sulfur oxidation DsrE/DsrF family protein
MKAIAQILLALYFLFFCASLVSAGEEKPWGSANVLNIDYEPQKVLYDLSSGDKDILSSVLDRAGYLFKLYGSDTFDSSIVIVIHGDAIPFFAISELESNRDIMTRAQSLTVGTSIEFRMCRAAARLLNYEAKDIHGFVNMVPMADAEIVRLQHEGYAYMQ